MLDEFRNTTIIRTLTKFFVLVGDTACGKQDVGLIYLIRIPRILRNLCSSVTIEQQIIPISVRIIKPFSPIRFNSK